MKVLYFKLSNNNNQYCLIFQSSPLLVPHITDSLYWSSHSSRTHSDLIYEYQNPNVEEIKYPTFLILLLYGY